MNSRKNLAVLLFLSSGLAFTFLIFFHPIKARGREPQGQSSIYNPYPPGILPADLESEIARVLREIDII